MVPQVVYTELWLNLATNCWLGAIEQIRMELLKTAKPVPWVERSSISGVSDAVIMTMTLTCLILTPITSRLDLGFIGKPHNTTV